MSKFNLFVSLIFVLMVISLSGCSNSSQMCFCHSKTSGVNHWIFVPNLNPNPKDLSSIFLFRGSSSQCHSACNRILGNSLSETHISNGDSYLGVESHLVSVDKNELSAFARAAGINRFSALVDAGYKLDSKASFQRIYSNLNSHYSDLSSVLQEPKFAFLTQDFSYCGSSQVCAWTSPSGQGSVSDFNADIKNHPSLVDSPYDYGCVSHDEASVVVNDRFCWLSDPSLNPPLCPNVKCSNLNKVPIYGCVCSDSSSSVSYDNVKSLIVTRTGNRACSNGKVVVCNKE